MNCKKIQAMGVKVEDVVLALQTSAVEVREDGFAIRRQGNVPLPALQVNQRKGKGKGKSWGKQGGPKGGKGRGDGAYDSACQSVESSAPCG
eukprot:CAMPEP_0117574112 /NCGR_PEP_ID=MMETSP0784-20121206/61375_1 /TAXON_ID=39447 /ORGANISM="" /LENGTH=90 /DNA_ID=CAMNT_0005372845 /DNA_START=30 /DNA_END=302 /DNA_ORIENTATION=+